MMHEIVFDASLDSVLQERACDKCREHKLKCDRRIPCATCQRKSISCVYGKASISGRKRRRLSTSDNETPVISDDASVAVAEQQEPNLDIPRQHSNDSQQFPIPSHSNDRTNSLNLWADNQVINIFDSADLWQDVDVACDVDLDFGLFDENIADETFWPTSINMELVDRLVLTYMRQINPSMPVMRSVFLQQGIATGRFLGERDFAACLLAVCAFICLQSHAATRSAPLAKQFLTEAISLYSNTNLGQNPSVETMLACFLIFGSLWTLGKDNAAWLRLQEVINLARISKIDQLQSPEQDEHWQSKFQLYLGLVVVERAFAAGRDHRISLPEPNDHDLEIFTNISATLQVEEQKNAAALRILARSFGMIDDEVLVCWRNKCENTVRPGFCERLSRRRISQTLQSFPGPKSQDWNILTRPYSESRQESFETEGAANERGDVLMTCIWLQNRFWHLALTHGLLSANDNCQQLRFDYVSILARQTLDVCKAFQISSFECHGQGLAEKIFDIASDHLGIARCLNGTANIREEFLENTEEVLPPGPPIVRDTNTTHDTPVTILSMDTPGIEGTTKKQPVPSDFEIATGLLGFLAIFNNGRNTKFRQYLTKYTSFIANANSGGN